MSFNIAFFADTHIGYRARVKNTPKGINVRVQDGYDALRETISQIINSEQKIDAVVHGGDLFHTSQPTMRDIYIVNFYLRALSKAGIPFYGLAGNHDATDIRSEMASVAAVNDPDRGIHALFEPYQTYELTDGIVLHSMSHHGLHEDTAPEVKASSDVLNVFATHGAALDPKNQTLLRCMDSPREQIIPVEMVTDDIFTVKLLGHYHKRHAVGGPLLNTWYSGSAVRRGFTDETGPRGWLLVQMEPNGVVNITPQNIAQRPQFDLATIDAADLNASEVMNLMEINLEGTTGLDKEPIVRQRISNASRTLKEGLDQKKIQELTQHALSWQLEYPKFTTTVDDKKVQASLSSDRRIDVIDNYRRFIDSAAKQVPEEYREIVVKDAEKYLAEARDLSELDGGKH